MEPENIPPIPQAAEDNFVTAEENLVRAETGTRFLNYIIDMVIFYVFMFFVGVFLMIAFPAAMESYISNDEGGFNLADKLLSLFLYAIYMSLLEAILQGKSFGKMITKTRAVNWDGSTISTGTAFARGFSRAVPFCVLSAFVNPCNPWQDRWTDTMVIDERKSIRSLEV